MKIPIPLTDLMNKNMYGTQVMKAFKPGENNDTINLNDDRPELLFGPEVDGKPQ